MLLGYRIRQKSILWPLVVVMLPGWLVLVALVRRPAADWHVRMAFRERVAQVMRAYDFAEWDLQTAAPVSTAELRARVEDLYRQWHEAGLRDDSELVDEALVWLRFGEQARAAERLAEVEKPEMAGPFYTLTKKLAQSPPAAPGQAWKPLEADLEEVKKLARSWPGDWYLSPLGQATTDRRPDMAKNEARNGWLLSQRLHVADLLLTGLGILALLLAWPAWRTLGGPWRVWPWCERMQRLWPMALVLCALSLRGLALLLGGTVARMLVPLVSTAGQHDFLVVYTLQTSLNFAFGMAVAVATTYGVKEFIAGGWGTLGEVLGFEWADFKDRRLWLVAFPCAVALMSGLEPLGPWLEAHHLGAGGLYDSLSRSPAGYPLLAAVLSVMQAVLVAPLIEEMIYRGFLLSALRNGLGTVGGVLLSSAIYALAHGASLTGTITAFCYGIGYALLKLHTGRLGAAMVMHGCVALIGVAVVLIRGG